MHTSTHPTRHIGKIMSYSHSEQLNPTQGGIAVERLLWLVFGEPQPVTGCVPDRLDSERPDPCEVSV